jgi:ribosomal protein L37E
MSETENRIDLYCPQCGEDTDELHEGYCEVCCYNNQQALDDHNYSYRMWQELSRQEREDQIRRAMHG